MASKGMDSAEFPPFWYYVLSESLLHLPLWLIFRHMHLNLINVRSTYAS